MSGGWDSGRGACCETCYTERIQKYEDHPCKLVIYRTKGVPSWGSGGAPGGYGSRIDGFNQASKYIRTKYSLWVVLLVEIHSIIFIYLNQYIIRNYGGGGGIRTHGTRQRTHAFQACALSRSATPPNPISHRGPAGNPV